MRGFIVFAFVLSTSAMACPNLSGNYKVCTSSTGSTTSDTVITQSVRNGVTTYVMSHLDDETGERISETYVADGKVRTQSETDPESGITFSTRSLVSCAGNNLKMNIQISAQGETFANINVTTTKVGQRMTSVTSGTIFGEPQNETEVCE